MSERSHGTAEAAEINIARTGPVEREDPSGVSITRAVTMDPSGVSVPRAVTMEVDGSGEAHEVACDVPRAVTVEIEGPDKDASVPEVPERFGRGSRAQIKTARLDSRDFRPSWPIAIASLEQLSGWAVLALRLGTLALIQQCVRELSEQDARADLIVRLRTLTDALAHMPLET